MAVLKLLKRFYILNQESEPDLPYNMEATDHIAKNLRR